MKDLEKRLTKLEDTCYEMKQAMCDIADLLECVKKTDGEYNLYRSYRLEKIEATLDI